MKKIIFITVLSLMAIGVFPQDSIQLSTLTLSTFLPEDARVYFWYVDDEGDTIDRNIIGEYLQPWTFTADGKIYPRSLTYPLGIGTSEPSSLYLLDAAVPVRFQADVVFGANGSLNFNDGSKIDVSGNDIRFYSPAAGTKTLSDLVSGSTAPSAFNALTKVSAGYKLGGTLSENTTISLNGKYLNTAGGILGLYSTSANLSGTTYLNLYSQYKFNIQVDGYTGTYSEHEINLDSILVAEVNEHKIEMRKNTFDLIPATDKKLRLIGNNEGISGIIIKGVDSLIYSSGDTLTEPIVKTSGDTAYTDYTVFKADEIEASSELTIRDSTIIQLIEEHGGEGGGDVSVSGTPEANQMAKWTDAETIAGSGNVSDYSDSTVFSDEVHVNDSVYLNNLRNNSVRPLFLTETGAIDAGEMEESNIQESGDYILYGGDTLSTRSYTRIYAGEGEGTTPAGGTRQVQFNDGGAFGADEDFEYKGDTLYLHEFDGADERPVTVQADGGLDIGSAEELTHCVTLNISSANLLAGDSLLILAAPGAGKSIEPFNYVFYYDYNSTAYTGGVGLYIATYSRTGTVDQMLLIYEDIIQSTVDVIVSYPPANDTPGYIYGLQAYKGLNKPICLHIPLAFSNGDGTAILKIFYHIVDFN